MSFQIVDERTDTTKPTFNAIIEENGFFCDYVKNSTIDKITDYLDSFDFDIMVFLTN